MHKSVLALLLLAPLWSGCAGAGRFAALTYRGSGVAFRVGPLPPAWQPARAGYNDVVFHHDQGGVISANGLCHHVEDVPLDVLTNHLLFGFEQKREFSRAPLTLDGRGALRTLLTARLDGVDVQMDLVVTKKDGCTYDLQLIAPPALFAARAPDFAAFVSSFAALAVR